MGTPWAFGYICLEMSLLEKEIDMIVMGTHGRPGLEKAIFGNTAEKVVKKAPCPELTVRQPEREAL